MCVSKSTNVSEMLEFFNQYKDSKTCLYALFKFKFEFNESCSESDFIDSEIVRLSLIEMKKYDSLLNSDKPETEEEFENRLDYNDHVWRNIKANVTTQVMNEVNSYKRAKQVRLFQDYDNDYFAVYSY